MNEIRGKYRDYLWHVFSCDTGKDFKGWRGEWIAPTGETGKTLPPHSENAKEAEQAVIACIEEHLSPTYSAPLEDDPA